MTPDEIVQKSVPRWEDCEGLEESTLIRISILRDLLTDLHTEKSSLLSRGKRDEANAFREWEQKIEILRTASPLPLGLNDLLKDPTQARKRTRLIPDALYSFVPREKLERYDRTWEATLSAEGAALGWCFWAVDFWVKIDKIDQIHLALSYQLTPHGVILFSETASGALENVSQSAVFDSSKSEADTRMNEGLWKSRWFVLLKPRYRTPDFQLDALPGVSELPDAPQWRLLFSPKKR
jgi:hypothetical protein